jgi:hypothetical protein
MAAKRARELDPTVELLRDLLIVQLGLAGLGQREIRKIAQCDIVRVNRIVKHLKVKKDSGGKNNG